MSNLDDVKKIKGEELARKEKMVAEYQARLKGNEEMVREVQKILDGFRKDHQEMAAAMRMKLVDEKEERLRSFTQMMTDIHSVILRIQKEVEGIRSSAANYCRDCSSGHSDMASTMRIDLENMNQQLKKTCSEMKSARHSDMQKVQKDVSTIIQDADNLLKQFAKDHSSMSAKQVQELGTSRKDLAQIDKERLSEFKTFMGGIRKSVQEMREHVYALLDEFTAERLGATAQQKKPAEPQDVKPTLDEKPEPKPEVTEQVKPAEEKAQDVKSIPEEEPKSKPKASKKAPTKPRKPLQSKDAKKAPSAALNAKEAGSPVNEGEKKKDKTEVVSLEDKMLNYIYTHKQGITIVAMEKPLGVSRMKLNYIAEQLLNEDKIQKVNNKYYPKSE